MEVVQVGLDGQGREKSQTNPLALCWMTAPLRFTVWGRYAAVEFASSHFRGQRHFTRLCLGS